MIAARTILALQTIVSREVKPGEMAVVTVGYIQAGTKNNIIPDQAEMGLTVRTYKPDVRKQILAAITRIAKAEAAAAGAPREPLVERYEGTDSVYNDPALAERLRGAAGSGAGQRQCGHRRADHAFGRFLLLRRAGRSRLLFQPGRSRPGKVRGGQGIGKSAAVESLSAVRSRRRSRAARGHRGGGRGAGNLLNASPEELHKLTEDSIPLIL